MGTLMTKTTALVLAMTASVFAPTTAFATFTTELPVDVPPINCLWGTLWNPETLRSCEDNSAPFDASSLAIPSPLQPLIDALSATPDITITHSNEQNDNDINVLDQHRGLRERITDRVLDAAMAAADLT
jgi:hypothetical protein